MTISVIIPTMNGSAYIPKLLNILAHQTVVPNEIVVVDSQSNDDTVELAKSLGARIIQIRRGDFDHGRTRDFALRTCSTDLVLFLTQDAMPQNEHYVENLIKPFADEKVAICSGRQLPRDDAFAYERLIREFNYPSLSSVRSKKDIPTLGIKTYFFSDVCSAYRKEVYEKLGGFEFPLLTDEDLFFAIKVIDNDYKVAYASDACVIHSHNLSLKEQFIRNYIQGVEFKNHKDLLNGISLESEGMKLVKYVSKKLINSGNYFSLIPFYADCAARLLGSKAGRK